MADVELLGVAKRFDSRAGAVDALAPVDLQLEQGEVVAVVGPSGCGKTTLLRCTAGLTRPSAGTVRLHGRDLWAGRRPDAEAMRSLAIVFQDANLLPWLTVEDNVALPLQLRGVPRKERRRQAAELCERTGIGGFTRHRPRELSIGMRQRVALSRALVDSPRLLLLDEPFASLDAITRDAMNLELQRVLADSGCTGVLVTHSMSEAVFLADRVVSLSARPGRVVDVTAVPFARPRAMALQHTSGFQQLVHQLRCTLGEAA
ncbi:MAG TPA: ABC transporter ATP-binding protein [Acidimicrobiales bacterium]|nr:ABC transporter ATP-binding protein [Acidimicrobiales bacterium]